MPVAVKTPIVAILLFSNPPVASPPFSPVSSRFGLAATKVSAGGAARPLSSVEVSTMSVVSGRVLLAAALALVLEEILVAETGRVVLRECETLLESEAEVVREVLAEVRELEDRDVVDVDRVLVVVVDVDELQEVDRDVELSEPEPPCGDGVTFDMVDDAPLEAAVSIRWPSGTKLAMRKPGTDMPGRVCEERDFVPAEELV